MYDDPTTLAYARRTLREAVYVHFSDPNITMVEFGFKERDGQTLEDEVAIRFHVRQKFSEPALEQAEAQGVTHRLPKIIGPFQTDVVEAIYRPHRRGWPTWGVTSRVNLRASQADPLRGGISISDEFHHTYGTLGGLVIDRASGAELILSNWHVLVGEWWARPGQHIYQPGRLDGGTHHHSVATLTRDAMHASLDAAVATLNGARGLINDQVDLGPVRGANRASLGMEVTKSGRRTNVTVGRVEGVEGIVKIRYGHLERLIRHIIRIAPLWAGGEVSGPGDSGSLWLDRTSYQAIGLHFAGSNLPEQGLALDILSVLEALQVDLVITE